MRRKSFIAVAGIVIVLLAGAAGVYAYDSGRKDVIAKGVTIGGVDVGGMKAAEAKATLRRQLLDPLSRPVVARHGRRHFTLTPEAARVGVNVDSMVDTALARSRDGGILSRTVRNLTGGEVAAAMAVQITYDHDAVNKVVKRAQRALDREPVDAKVSFDGGQISQTKSRSGRQVDTTALRRTLKRRLTSLTAAREVDVPVAPVKPKVTSAALADEYPSAIIVNRGAFTLRLFKHLKEVKSYRVAVGQVGLETPQGLYKIENMAENPSWHVPQSAWAGDLAGQVIPPGPQNPIKARWMGIYNGAGIHGTDAISSLGSAASHGCIRMSIPDVEDLYGQVQVGTPVYIL
jgi:lipoprotein-anchoring transpeptidase ErfK/SrfK